MGTLFDTSNADVESTFEGLTVDGIGAYVNGRYANATAARAAFPNAHVLGIDVLGEGVGHAGDFEPGDMSYGEAGGWAKKRIADGIVRPVIYFSVTNWSAVLASVQAAGLTRSHVRLWTAHYNGHPHLCSAACEPSIVGHADATQWGSSDAHGTLPAPYAGRNMDVSETATDFW